MISEILEEIYKYVKILNNFETKMYSCRIVLATRSLYCTSFT